MGGLSQALAVPGGTSELVLPINEGEDLSGCVQWGRAGREGQEGPGSTGWSWRAQDSGGHRLHTLQGRVLPKAQIPGTWVLLSALPRLLREQSLRNHWWESAGLVTLLPNLNPDFWMPKPGQSLTLLHALSPRLPPPRLSPARIMHLGLKDVSGGV